MEIQKLKVGDLFTNCYFVVSEKEVLIVDPGGDIDLIIEKLNQLGKENKYIVLTHYHPDHTQATQELKKNNKTEVLIHKADAHFLNFTGIGADKLVKGEEKIKINGDSLEIIHTPGHTEGSICLMGDNFILTGDTLFEDGHGRTDLPGGSSREMKKSLQKINSLLKPGMMVYPGHGNPFSYQKS